MPDVSDTDHHPEAELKQIKLRLGCFARVGLMHQRGYHREAKADDCLVCWPDEVIHEFRVFTGDKPDPSEFPKRKL